MRTKLSHLKEAAKAVVWSLIWAGKTSWQTELLHRKFAAIDFTITRSCSSVRCAFACESSQQCVLCAGAAAALCNLAEGSAEVQAAICQAGALDRFPALLQGALTSGGLIVEVPHCSARAHAC